MNVGDKARTAKRLPFTIIVDIDKVIFMVKLACCRLAATVLYWGGGCWSDAWRL